MIFKKSCLAFYICFFICAFSTSSRSLRVEPFLSLSDIQPAFSHEDLGFISLMTEDVLEEKLRLSFPEALRDRAKKYIKPVLRFSAHHKIDPLWVLSIMWNESHFRSDALSGKGAKGLMQLISSTKEDVIKRYNGRGEAFFIEKDDFRIHDFFPGISSELVDKKRRALLNLEVAIIYLKELLDLFENDYRLATIAYNMGPTRIKMQVENKIPVGHNHRYLKKILHSYHYISKQLVHYDVVTKITR